MHSYNSLTSKEHFRAIYLLTLFLVLFHFPSFSPPHSHTLSIAITLWRLVCLSFRLAPSRSHSALIYTHTPEKSYTNNIHTHTHTRMKRIHHDALTHRATEQIGCTFLPTHPHTHARTIDEFSSGPVR